MTEIKRPPAPPGFRFLSLAGPKAKLKIPAAREASDSYQPRNSPEAIQAISTVGSIRSDVVKSIAPPLSHARSDASSLNASLMGTFFNGTYEAPGQAKTLSSLRDEAFSAGFPFFFIVKEIKDEGESKVKLRALPCSTFYYEVDKADQRDVEGDTEVYVLKKGSTEAISVGSINDIESEKNPLGHHLLMLNNEQFGIEDPENIRGETIAAASILFELGVCVPADKVLAAGLMTNLTKDEQRYYIGRVMIDSLLEEDYRCAEACIKYGGQVQSVDDHGHLAISCALRPGAHDFLQALLQRTGDAEDVPILRSILRNSSLDLDPAIRRVLTENVTRLSGLNSPA